MDDLARYRGYLAVLRTQIQKGQELLRPNPVDKDAYGRWESTTQQLVKDAFGPGHDYAKRFARADLPWVGDGPTEHELAQWRRDDLKRQLNHIQSCIEYIDAVEDAAPNRSPRDLYRKRIRLAIKQIDTLAKKNALDAEFEVWREGATQALETAFGPKHAYFLDFSSITFSEPVVHDVNAGWSQEDQREFAVGMARSRQTLENAAEELALDAQDTMQAKAIATQGKPTKRTSPKPQTIVYNVTGANARVNVHSTDSSTNVVETSATELFVELRKALGGIEDTGQRAVLMSHVGDLEKAHGQPSFVEKYQAFVAAAANHMTVLAPFLPGLTQMLGS